MNTLTRLAAALSLPAALAFATVTPALAQTAMKISISVGQNSHQGIGIDTFVKEVDKHRRPLQGADLLFRPRARGWPSRPPSPTR
jgi:hypothetical protein